jgi:hypothetical protein
MKTILIILALIFIFIPIVMYIIESRIKNRTNSELCPKWKQLTDSDLIDEIEKK